MIHDMQFIAVFIYSGDLVVDYTIKCVEQVYD